MLKGFNIPSIRIVKIDDEIIGLIYYELYLDEKYEGRYPDYSSLSRRIDMMISEECLSHEAEGKHYD